MLKKEGVGYDVILTQEGFSENKQALKQQAQFTYTEIWACGGDGTLHQLINCLPNEFWQLPVAIIPTGSGNDFVKNYGVSSLNEATAIALNGKPQVVDVWQCNNKLFIHGIGIGFDGKVVEDMLKRKTIFKGFLAYYYHVLRLLLTYKEKEFIVAQNGSETTFPCFMITVANSTTFGGGFKITPNAQISDGLLDVCAISKVPKWLRPRYLKSVEKGLHLKLPYVKYSTTNKLSINTPEVVAGHIDGELFYGKEFEIIKFTKQLNIILPN